MEWPQCDAMRRIDAWALPLLVTIGVVIPFGVALVSGSLVIPHNDDFNYRRVALQLYRYGSVELTGWTVMSLIGQLLLVQPFLWLTGGASWAFGVMTTLIAAVGIVASYFLVRPILSAERAFIAVLTVIVFPGFVLNTWNFMTDLPAYAAAMVCLVLGAPVLRRHESNSWPWLAASLATGVFAFSIREFALAAPVAVLMAAIVTHGPRRSYLVAAVVLFVSCGAVYYLTSHLPGQGVPALTPLSAWNIHQIFRAVATLALGLSPILVLSTAWWLPRANPLHWFVGGIIGILLFNPYLLAWLSGAIPEMVVGNLLAQVGAPGSGVMAGDRPVLFVDPLWALINASALLSAILLFVVLGAIIGTAGRRGLLRRPLVAYRRIDAWSKLLVGLTVVYASGLLAFGLVASMFDRYLWPLALPLGALLLTKPRWVDRSEIVPSSRRLGLSSVIAGVLLMGLTVSAFALLLNAAAFDAARWRLGEVTVSRGFPRETVDAGMEWVGYHANGPATVWAPLTQGGMWYSSWWNSHTTCVAVSSSLLDLPGFTLYFADTQAYRLFLFAGPEAPLYLYRVANPGCS